jgi:hypothetical protein
MKIFQHSLKGYTWRECEDFSEIMDDGEHFVHRPPLPPLARHAWRSHRRGLFYADRGLIYECHGQETTCAWRIRKS